MEKEKLEQVIKESKSINEVLKKLGKNDSSGAYKSFHKLIKKYDIDISHFWTARQHIEEQFKNGKIKKILNEDIFIENSIVSRHIVKTRILKEKLLKYECVFCGNDGDWMGKKISLILDHINGYNNDNRITNLRFICPNCDATLDTHCKGHKGIEDKIKKENKIDKRKIYKPRVYSRKTTRPNLDVLLQQVKDNGYRGTGRIYGVSDVSIRKWIKWATNQS